MLVNQSVSSISAFFLVSQSLGVRSGWREERGPAEEVSRGEIVRRSAIQSLVGQDVFLSERSVLRTKHGYIYQMSGSCGEWVVLIFVFVLSLNQLLKILIRFFLLTDSLLLSGHYVRCSFYGPRVGFFFFHSNKDFVFISMSDSI